MRIQLIAATAVLSVAAGGQAWAADFDILVRSDVAILARSGGSPTQQEADIRLCAQVATRRAAPNTLPIAQPYRPVYYTPIASGGDATAGAYVVGGLIGAAVVVAVRGALKQNTAERRCLQNLGYGAVTLTPEERGERGRLNGAAVDAWDAAFMARDLSARIQQTNYPATPPLPAYGDGTWTGGGVRLDPATLKAASGEVRRGSVILTAKGVRRATAVLDEDIETVDPKSAKVVAKAGAVFHQVDYRLQQHPLLMRPDATWCGPVSLPQRSGAPRERTFCFTATGAGYEIYDAGSPGVIGAPFYQSPKPVLWSRPLRLTPTQTAGAPFDVEIEVGEIKGGHIELMARAMGQGEPGRNAFIWTRRVDVRRDQAILPLWDKALRITVGRNKILRAELVEGDGKGWMYDADAESALGAVSPQLRAQSSVDAGSADGR